MKIERLIDLILGMYKKHLNIEKKQEAILKYSLTVLLQSIIGYTLTLGFAWIFDIFWPALMIIITFSAFRSFSGGAHCSSPLNCELYSVISVNALAFISKLISLDYQYVMPIAIFTMLFSFWAIAKYAPADTPAKPITDPNKRYRLKKYSLTLLCIWSASMLLYFKTAHKGNMVILASSLGLLFQSFSITKSGYAFWKVSDELLNIIRMKRGGRVC